MQRRKVLLPEPELPIMAMTSPSRAESEMPFSTSRAPNFLCRSSTTSAGVVSPIFQSPACGDAGLHMPIGARSAQLPCRGRDSAAFPMGASEKTARSCGEPGLETCDMFRPDAAASAEDRGALGAP